MPIIYEIQYDDESTELVKIPAEIWRKGENKTSRVHVSEKKITRVVLDPFMETADIDTENNYFPREEQFSKFEIFKINSNRRNPENPLQREKKNLIKP